MAEKRPEPCENRCIGAPLPCDPDSERALEGIEDEGRRRQILAPGTQHICRADIARADLAHVTETRQGASA